MCVNNFCKLHLGAQTAVYLLRSFLQACTCSRLSIGHSTGVALELVQEGDQTTEIANSSHCLLDGIVAGA